MSQPAVMIRSSEQRSCIRGVIRDQLVARILDGSYPPGFRFKELGLAREFNVSQAPVREALRELEVLGLATSEHYRGTRVREIDMREMLEVYELRATLEVRSAELAAPCGAEVLVAFEGDLQQMQAALEREDYDTYIGVTLRFHRRLVEASGNRVFLATWDGFNWEVRGRVSFRRILNSAGSSAKERLGEALGLHRLVYEGLRANDITAVGSAVRECFRAVLA